MAEDASDVIVEKLRQWAKARGGKSARVDAVRDLGGHSGETWGFTYLDSNGREDLVIRLAPAAGGERARAELVRQAPLLDALHSSGALVARLREVSEAGAPFDTAYLIVDRIEGRPLIMGPDAGPCWLDAVGRQAAYERAAAELARIHRPEVAERLGRWDAPRSPTDEISLWTRTFERAAEPGWTAEGKRLGEALLASAPATWEVGLCHGDFQTNNILFAEDGDRVRVGGVIDWEIAHIGAIDHDLGWFLMMNDPAAWDAVEQRGGVDLDAIVARYEVAAGRNAANLNWFRALAGYRIAAIAGYRINQHRTGRREDAAWARSASSIPYMFDRAHALLAAA